ncbi:MAG: uracil-DNA glycosylase family protein [Candidatus Saccharibacteria bacterium]
MPKAREKIISRIVKMESRISSCSRCQGIRICSPKPSLGRGDVQASIMVVFPQENEFTRSREKIAQMRETLASLAGEDRKVYHTYMIRCQPRSCHRRKGKDTLFDGTLIDASSNCILTNAQCDGQVMEPDDQEAMNCLIFLLEEIEIIMPEVIITLGERVYQYLFRAFNILDPYYSSFNDVRDRIYRSNASFLIPTDIPLMNSDSMFSGLTELFKVINHTK